ncbi:hypothetical protein [Cellulomonas sp. NPDC089187]|uniref:hypothetical protein n=1 Tax=Cellulomonas sp. NPDC089187 TaxID=3154970 RepID=UPI003428EE31
MKLFKNARNTTQVPTPDAGPAIAAFWSWWTANADRLAATFDARDVEAINRLGEETAQQVTAIDPDLTFEYGPGDSSRHRLMVTASGNPRLRALADQWLAAAPPADEAFAFDSWKQPNPNPGDIVLGLGEVRVDLVSSTVALAPDGARTAVELFHPGFAELPDEVRGQITFLFLDMTVGEQVVETRIGRVSWTDTEPAGAVPLTTLPSLLV